MFRRLLSLNHRIPLRYAAKDASIYRLRFLPSAPKRGFRWLIYSSMVVLWYRTAVELADDQPMFIPLGFARKEGPPRRFTEDDPEPTMFRDFHENMVRRQRAIEVFVDKTCQILHTSFQNRLGGDIRANAALLYFHYPTGPPITHLQKGLRISHVEDLESEESAPASDEVARIGNLGFEVVDREIDSRTMFRYSNIFYPARMFNSVVQSVRETYHVSSRVEERERALDDTVGFGMAVAKYGLRRLKENIQRTRKPPPPPRGHVLIDGMIQIVSQNMIVTVDLTGTFHPENLNQITIQRMSVRFSAKLKKREQAIEMVPQRRDAVIDTIKQDTNVKIAAALARNGIKKQREMVENGQTEQGKHQPPDAATVVSGGRLARRKADVSVEDAKSDIMPGQKGPLPTKSEDARREPPPAPAEEARKSAPPSPPSPPSTSK